MKQQLRASAYHLKPPDIRKLIIGFCQLSRHFAFLQLAVYTHPSERRM
jgi:hypothetical protein